MKLTRFTFGERVLLNRRKSGGVSYFQGSKYWSLDEERVELASEEVESTYGDEPERGPFERADFGDRERLAWATGACAIVMDARLTYWGQRYAMWFDDYSLCAIDATRPLTVRVALPIEVALVDKAMHHEGRLYFPTARGVVVIETPEIEGLFDRATGLEDIDLREHYPLRAPAARYAMQVEYVWSDEIVLRYQHGGRSDVRLPLIPIERGDLVTVHHRLATDQFLEYSIGDGPRISIYQDDFPTERSGGFERMVEPAVDPAGTLVRGSTAVRGEELDRMFGLLADEPDEATRMVVVDLLEDAGEPYAPMFAKLLAGDDSGRDDALGLLSRYLVRIEWFGGLPRGATLSETAPLDAEIGDVAMSDHRLGFFETLRLGEGNFRLYAKLVASPRLVGLRHVDGSRVTTLKALIAAGRTTIRRLSSVKFASREVIEALADPTFDRVVEIETETQASLVERLLEYIARDEATFFARAPRHLELLERADAPEALAHPILAAWPRLPLAKLTFGGLTLCRDGTAIAQPESSSAVRAIVASHFRID